MTQPALTLYHFPPACSQVALFALEHAGLDYTLDLVNLAVGAQTQPGYLAVSPLGKVPLLTIDGDPLTENAAILTYVAALAPNAGLFPADVSPRVKADIVGGLAFCGGTLHPIIRGVANPSRMTTGEGEPVRERSIELAKKAFGHAEKRLAERGWWLAEWSVIDVYINWTWSVARHGGFGAEGYPELAGLAGKLGAYPAFRRMTEINAEARASLGL